MQPDLVPTTIDTAGHHLVRSVATATAADTVEAALRRLRRQSCDCLEYLHIVDEQGRLTGLVPMTALMAAAGDTRLEALAEPQPEALGPELDQEHLLSWAARNRIPAPPVVDADGRLLGCVPPAALIQIGRREHAEDISRLAGILHLNNHGRHALDAPPWQRALHRLPWLLIGLIGSIAATAVMARFEQQLSMHIAVAFFVPAIVYLADAIGTQTEAVVVRGLSFFHAPRFLPLLRGELSVGILVGAAVGAVTLPLVYLGFGEFRLALAVALAVSMAGALATVCGLVFPWLLLRLGLDPAFGSGPVATVIQDVLSLLIYFLAVRLVLPG